MSDDTSIVGARDPNTVKTEGHSPGHQDLRDEPFETR